MEDYFKKIEDSIKKKFHLRAKILVNALDYKRRGMNECYLTVLETSADSGDSGEVGRGNRGNGLIR